MTSCGDSLKAGNLLQTISVKGLADSRIPDGHIAAVFDGYVSFHPQHPLPQGEDQGKSSIFNKETLCQSIQ